MRPLRDPSHRAIALLVVGLVVLVAAFGVSWALAPDTDTAADEADPANVTILVGVQGPGPNGNVTVLDGHGDVRWSLGDIISYQNVQRLDDGSVLATFAAGGYRNCGPYDSPCKRTGVRILDPNPGSDPESRAGLASEADADSETTGDSGTVTEYDPEVVSQWGYPVRTRKDSEVHDAEMLPSGDLLVADMEWESIFVLDGETRERVWTWNASDHYDAPDDPTTTDWLHINDVDRIEDGRYLVSVRNENQLLIVERGEGVVDVVNEDGDTDVLNQQHNPHWVAEGAVLVADSENHRVVELHENETTGEWEVAWSVASAGGIALDWPRDADRLPNGNTLITDSYNDRVVEVREDGSVAASYSVPSLPYEADRGPWGESAGGPVYDSERRADTGLLDRRIPVLSTVVAGARHVVALPYWVSEIHLVAVGVAVGLWIRGGISLLRARRGK
jgi:hypothetical protein